MMPFSLIREFFYESLVNQRKVLGVILIMITLGIAVGSTPMLRSIRSVQLQKHRLIPIDNKLLSVMDVQ